MQMQKFGASWKIVLACSPSSTRVCPNSLVSPPCYVYSRLCVCATDASGLTSSSREARQENDETRQLAPTRDREIQSISQSRMRFFARARSRGLSRSQPVFVIIMLEKCMNICFINASSYFISFYYDKRKSETELPETRAEIPLSLVIFIFIYTYYIYIYTCVLFDIAPIIAHSLSLASCASLIFCSSSPLSFFFIRICSTLACNHFLSLLLFLYYYYYYYFLSHYHAIRVAIGVLSPLLDWTSRWSRDFPRFHLMLTVHLEISFFPAGILRCPQASLHPHRVLSAECSHRESCFFRATFLTVPRARELRQARGPL